MKSSNSQALIEFLRQDLGLPAESISLAIRLAGQAPNLVPIILWQYGLVSLDQLNQIFDWLEKPTSF